MYNSSDLKPVKDQDGKVVPGLYRGANGALIVRDPAGLSRSQTSHQALDTINKELQELKAQVRLLLEKIK